MKMIIGANGRLGTAICLALGERNIVTPSRLIYEDWWQPGKDFSIGAYLDAQPTEVDCIFVTAGVIDPKATAAEHRRVNLELPAQLLRVAAPRGIRVVTFGSMMEAISNKESMSGYVSSKLALADLVQSTPANAVHIRINTLYGGAAPAPHMFAGQMLHALQTRSSFRMSPGNQLREYHHVDDESRAILAIAATELQGAINLNHGRPIKLARLAKAIFDGLDSPDLLHIGALPAPTDERCDLSYAPTLLPPQCEFRDALVGMTKYMQKCLASSQVKP